MTDDDRLAVAAEIAPDAVEPVVREAVVIVGIFGFLALALLLPGTERELPGIGLAVGDLVIVLATFAVVGTLLYAAPQVRELVVACLEGSPRVVDDAASIAQSVVVFAAVVVAHQGFSPAAEAFVEPTWAYDLTFLLLALAPLAIVAYRFNRALDPISRFLTETLLGGRRGSHAGASVGDEDRT